ncbi:MAG: class I SAM-dependent methyltransferase [Actinomycetota bacterium]
MRATLRSSVHRLRDALSRATSAPDSGPEPPESQEPPPEPPPSPRFDVPDVRDRDRATNLEWNRQRWGQAAGWTKADQYGYRWGGGVQQTVGGIAAFADEYLRPVTAGRYDLRVLELSPGGGRFTAELLRYASSITLVDMNEECLRVCGERFQYVPTPIEFVANDGESLAECRGPYDLIACYDSMVHMHPAVIEGYVRQMATLISPGGRIWLDHSGRGEREQGHRTQMTAEDMAQIAAQVNLEVESQRFRNDWDCVTVLRLPTS